MSCSKSDNNDVLDYTNNHPELLGKWQYTEFLGVNVGCVGCGPYLITNGYTINFSNNGTFTSTEIADYPTGTFVEAGALHAFLTRVPTNVLVVLDEAYTEYLDATRAYKSIPWLSEFPNLIVSRTLSKAYGLAGLRVGFGLASPEIIALMNRVRQPFNVNHLAMVAAAAALEDDEFIAESRKVNAEGIGFLTAAFAERSLEIIDPFGNFITFKIDDAAGVYRALLKSGVIVRPIAGYGMPDWLRVTIGTRAQNERFVAALDRVTSKGS